MCGEGLLSRADRGAGLVGAGQAVDARRAFSACAYKRVGKVPIYLEWAPQGILAGAAAAAAARDGGGEFSTETAPLVLLKNLFQAIGGSHIQPTWRRRETHFQAIGGSHI